MADWEGRDSTSKFFRQYLTCIPRADDLFQGERVLGFLTGTLRRSRLRGREVAGEDLDRLGGTK